MFCSQCIVKLELVQQFREVCLASEANRNKLLIKIEEDSVYEEPAHPQVKVEEALINDFYEIQTEGDSADDVKHEIIDVWREGEEVVADGDHEYKTETQDCVIEEVVAVKEFVSETEDLTSNTFEEGQDPLIETNNLKNTDPVVKKRRRSKNIKLVTCKFCNHKTFGPSKLLNHIRAKHTFEKPFKCDLCEKAFSSLGMLRTHKNFHSNERKYVCHHCNECFKFRTNMRVHILTQHEDPKNWKHVCPFCSKRFPIKTSFTAHVSQHTGEKRFVCDTCDKSFYDRSALRNHRGIHSGERPFKCDLCPKDYRRKCLLIGHKKRVHSLEVHKDCEENIVVEPPPQKDDLALYSVKEEQIDESTQIETWN